MFARKAGENAASLGLTGKETDLSPLKPAWLNLVLLQFHDILPGSSIGEVYTEAAADHASIQSTARKVRADALATLAETPSLKTDLTIFNSLSWPRSELPSAEPAVTSARIRGGQLVIALGKEWGATLPQIRSLAFFPYDEGGIEYAAPQTLVRTKDAVELSMKLGDRPPKAGVIRLGES